MNRPQFTPLQRKSFLVRVWKRKGNSQDWIGELQEVETGAVEHIYGLDALCELLKSKIMRSDEKNKAFPATTQGDKTGSDR